MSRLVVVSNRVAIPDPEGPRQAGGLAVAVNAALKHREGLWFGWSGETSFEGAINTPKVVERRQRSFVTIDLSPTDYQEYYNGFANRVLWPILHYRVDLAEFTAVELGGYLRVNAHFADALSQFIRPDDWIWVHDYHLLARARACQPDRLFPAHPLPATRHPDGAAAARRDDGRAQPLRSGGHANRARRRKPAAIFRATGRSIHAQPGRVRHRWATGAAARFSGLDRDPGLCPHGAQRDPLRFRGGDAR